MAGVSRRVSSSSSSASASVAARLGLRSTKMDICLDNHYRAKVYSTGDAITGHVRITPARDTPFDQFEVVLLGVAHTRIDHTGVLMTSSHTFLKVAMPLDTTAYPAPRILEQNQTYRLPFYFVVPHHLTLNACAHPTASPAVHDHHVMLPPTLGAFGNTLGLPDHSAAWERSDMAPDMAGVEYTVRARVYRHVDDVDDAGSDKPVLATVGEGARPVRVLPASPVGVGAHPALTKADRLFRTHAAKTVRKGLFARTRLGTVTATACNAAAGAPYPLPIVLQPDAVGSASTRALVRLAFNPAKPDTPPPHIAAWSARITSHTHFSASGITDLPHLGDWAVLENTGVDRRGMYATSTALPTKPFKGPQKWVADMDLVRRDSGYTSESVSESAPACSPHALAYTALLDLDVPLPTHKRTFVPTFHSCILSRTYSLQLAITVVPASTGSSTAATSSGSSTTLNLSIPVQIVVAAPAESTDGLPSFEDALEDAAADAHLQPRLLVVPASVPVAVPVAVPEEQYQGTSTLPSYS